MFKSTYNNYDADYLIKKIDKLAGKLYGEIIKEAASTPPRPLIPPKFVSNRSFRLLPEPIQQRLQLGHTNHIPDLKTLKEELKTNSSNQGKFWTDKKKGKLYHIDAKTPPLGHKHGVNLAGKTLHKDFDLTPFEGKSVEQQAAMLQHNINEGKIIVVGDKIFKLPGETIVEPPAGFEHKDTLGKVRADIDTSTSLKPDQLKIKLNDAVVANLQQYLVPLTDTKGNVIEGKMKYNAEGSQILAGQKPMGGELGAIFEADPTLKPATAELKGLGRKATTTKIQSEKESQRAARDATESNALYRGINSIKDYHKDKGAYIYGTVGVVASVALLLKLFGGTVTGGNAEVQQVVNQAQALSETQLKGTLSSDSLISELDKLKNILIEFKSDNLTTQPENQEAYGKYISIIDDLINKLKAVPKEVKINEIDSFLSTLTDLDMSLGKTQTQLAVLGPAFNYLSKELEKANFATKSDRAKEAENIIGANNSSGVLKSITTYQTAIKNAQSEANNARSAAAAAKK